VLLILFLPNKPVPVKKIGVIGFCMGGQLSLYTAAANPELVSACVDFTAFILALLRL
jgi:carboxymethylenebutenolidase